MPCPGMPGAGRRKKTEYFSSMGLRERIFERAIEGRKRAQG